MKMIEKKITRYLKDNKVKTTIDNKKIVVLKALIKNTKA